MRTDHPGGAAAWAVALVTVFVMTAHASAASIEDLLDGRSAMQAYQDGDDVRVRDLATGKDWTLFTRAASTPEPWTGGINRDGTKLCCTDGDRVCVVDLDGSNHQRVTPAGGSNGYFWRDDQGNDWVVYTGEPEHKDQSGTTWRVRIDAKTNKPIESSRRKIADQQYSAGLGGSGVYLFESYGKSYILNVKTGAKSVHLNDAQNCVGSANPGDQPWMMYEESPAHHEVVISEWNEDANAARYIWRYHHKPGQVFARWSTTDNRYATISKAGKLFLVRLRVDTRGDGDNTGSWTEAAMGISHYVGGVWIGEDDN